MKEETMKRILAGGTFMAVLMAFGMVAFAQPAGQTPAQPATPPAAEPAPQNPQPATPTTPQDRPSAMEQVTIVGCVQSEADYRKARDAGKGGVAGTGVGSANEYVLINASRAGGASAATPSGAPTGTTGATAAGEAFELTGPNESQVGQHVGKRVEIMGKLKRAEMGAAGPTGGATAGTPPTGVDVASRDLRLRELEVSSVKETTGTCPMQR